MATLFFTTGQVAKELNVTQDRIRNLCEAGVIEAELTPGQQWRIPQHELDRLKREDLPQIPRRFPTGSAPASEIETRRSEDGLPQYASEATVAALDENVRLKAEVEGLGLRQQKEQALDWFREREQEEAEQRDAEEEEQRHQLAEEAARRERDEWLQSWEQYALGSLPFGLPPEMRLEAHEAVRGRLEGLDPIPLREVTLKLVDSEVQKVVRVWERRKEIKKAIEEGRDSLPYGLKGYFWAPSDWDVRACEAAATAIDGLRPDASYGELRTAAIHAVKGVVAQYEAQKAAQADAGMRQSVIRCASLPAGLTDEVQDLAIRAVAEELAKLPLGTPRQEMERMREKLLEPLRAAVAQQAAAERQKQQDRAARAGILSWAPLHLPWGLPPEQKEQALAAITKAIAEIPEGTPQGELEQARDQALQPFVTAHERQKRKTQLIEDGLRELFPYLLKLERDWDFEGKPAQRLELEIREPIRKQLEKELSGDESADQAAKLIHRLVRESVGIQRRKVHVQKAS